MRYVLIISPEPLDVDLSGGADSEGGVWFSQHGPDITDWIDQPEKHARLSAMGTGRTVYAVHWKDLAVLRASLARTIARDDVMFDDGYELFVTGSELVAMLARNPGNHWWLEGRYD